MNSQIRRLYLVIVAMVMSLAMAATYIQFFAAPSLNADGRNSRTILHASERDRGPIIVAGEAIAKSEPVEGTKRFQRTYTQGQLYAAITGWFSASLRSSTGLEAAAEDVFEGDSLSLLTQRIQSLFTGSVRRGGGVVLTVDPAVQEAAAQGLAGRRGAAVALEPSTGRVLALYSSPSFDPNLLAATDTDQALAYDEELNASADRPLNNRAIAGDLYPPGSVFKLVTAAAMLESGLTPDSKVPGPASMELPGTSTVLPNVTGLPCGSQEPTLAEAFARSCNTTFALSAEKLGADVLREKARAFGFDSTLSIPLPVTSSSFPEDSDPAQMALAAIGQGKVEVTPLQMAMVGAAIANNGTLMKPYLIDSVVSADVVVQQEFSPKVLTKPINPKVAQQLRAMMVDVVDKPFGTANNISRGDGSIAAKTGTAETGRGDQTVGWIVAFAPADNPDMVVAVAVEGDESSPYAGGGSDAGPIARAMLDARAAK
ncbi:MAG: penicillin-binding transpeptidase domain-containing protein [Actinomycetaceae bacterium]|nr:penicillin-binding transpeptidase domain-containing protein [Actinomycetaceae bacterium]